MRRLALVLGMLPGLALAQSADQRPMPKPAALTAPVMSAPVMSAPVMAAAAPVAVAPSLRPKPRPFAQAAPVVATWTVPRPPKRPKGLVLQADIVLASAPQAEPEQKPARQTMKGAVCGRAEIKGQALAPMRSTTRGCGIADPVEVSAIAGVTFSPAPTINCAQATALSDWITGALQPAFNNQVAGLRVADSYSCRPRNNVRGNPPSVHGKGEAIDLSAVILTNGQAVEVKSRLDKRWQKARKAGCGIFNVILGPGSDGYHETHIHLDVSQHGGDPYCR